MVAFDPKTGKELWTCAGLEPLAILTAFIDEARIVVAMRWLHGRACALAYGREEPVMLHSRTDYGIIRKLNSASAPG